MVHSQKLRVPTIDDVTVAVELALLCVQSDGVPNVFRTILLPCLDLTQSLPLIPYTGMSVLLDVYPRAVLLNRVHDAHLCA